MMSERVSEGMRMRIFSDANRVGITVGEEIYPAYTYICSAEYI